MEFCGHGHRLSAVYFALFCIFYRNPSEDKLLTDAEREFIKRGGAQPEDRARAAKGAPLGYLLRQRRVCGLALGFASYNYSFYLFLTWLPDYLATTHHVDLLHAVLYTSVPWLFATITDLVIGGWLVDALIQRGWNAVRVRQAVLIGGTTLGLGILGAARARTPLEAVFWISIALGGLSAASPVGWSIPSLIAPRESVGTLGGIMNFATSSRGSLRRLSRATSWRGRNRFPGRLQRRRHSLSWALRDMSFFWGIWSRFPSPSRREAIVSAPERNVSLCWPLS